MIGAWVSALCSMALIGMQFRLCIRHLEGTATTNDQVAALTMALLGSIPIVMAACGLFLEPFVFIYFVLLGTSVGLGFVNTFAMHLTFGDERRAPPLHRDYEDGLIR